MDQNHVNQIVNAVRGQGSKVEPLQEITPEAWMTWRSNFVITAQIANWDDPRARLECARAMKGPAKQVTAHIPTGVQQGPLAGQNADPVADLLDLYEAVFVPQAATDAARAELRRIKQEENESILVWLTKVKYHFRRANPNMNAADVNANGDLKDLFIMGLANPDTKKGTIWARPANVQAAYEAAMSIDGASDVYGVARAGVHSMAALEKRRTFSRPAMTDKECWECGETGHISRFCKKKSPYFYGKRTRPGRGRGQANRRGNWKSPRGRVNNRPYRPRSAADGRPASSSLNAMEPGTAETSNASQRTEEEADYSQAYGDLEDYQEENHEQNFHQD